MKIQIHKRTRKLGYGWTTRPDGRDGRSIEEVPAPNVVGGLAAVRKERAERMRTTSGGVFYREALFYDGKRILGIHDALDVSLLLHEIEAGIHTEIEVADAK